MTSSSGIQYVLLSDSGKPTCSGSEDDLFLPSLKNEIEKQIDCDLCESVLRKKGGGSEIGFQVKDILDSSSLPSSSKQSSFPDPQHNVLSACRVLLLL